jgi:hypothetical protein
LAEIAAGVLGTVATWVASACSRAVGREARTPRLVGPAGGQARGFLGGALRCLACGGESAYFWPGQKCIFSPKKITPAQCLRANLFGLWIGLTCSEPEQVNLHSFVLTAPPTTTALGSRPAHRFTASRTIFQAPLPHPGPLLCQSLALETHWRASAVLSTASSAAGAKRTRSCSPTTMPTEPEVSCWLWESPVGCAAHQRLAAGRKHQGTTTAQQPTPTHPRYPSPPPQHTNDHWQRQVSSE